MEEPHATPPPGRSLLSLYRRMRRFALLASASLFGLAFAAVAIVAWRTQHHVDELARDRAVDFEDRITSFAAELAQGAKLSGLAVSRLAVSAEGRVVAADPPWLGGLDLGRGLLYRQLAVLAPGDYLLTFAPDLADMAQRPTLAVRTARGYEVATFAPRTFLGGLRHATELALVDGHGICRYASRPAAVGERAQVPALGWRGGRLWATSQVGLERTRGLTLFLSTDVTGELLLILAVVAAATGVAVSGRRLASRLDRDLAFLEVEARGVRDAIGAVAAALPEFDAAGAPEGGLRAALGPSLDQVRTLTPRFEEHQASLALLGDLGQNVVELVDRLAGRTAELAASRGRIEAALLNAPLPIMLHAEDGAVSLINGSWAELSGYAADEVPTVAAWLERAHPCEAEREQARRAYAPGQGLVATTIRTAGGEALTWELVSSRSGVDAAGRPLVITVATDVTERRRIEERLRDAERLNAIGALAGGVAHDLNNQLTPVLTLCELLLAGSGDADRELLEGIHTSARRSVDLTQQLLAFARKGKHLAVPVDLHALVGEVIGLVERTVDRRIQVVQELGAPRSWVRGDPSQLQSAILNLAINARDAMPEGGTLTVRTWCPSAEQVALEVCDTGVGIADEVRGRIFEPFFSTKADQGTGLGLAAVWGTVVNHGGEVTVETAPGEGARFRVELPALAAGAEAGPGAPSPAARAAGVAVLVVEDEPEVAGALERVLASHGQQVAALCPTGQSALDYLANPEAPVDVVLLDMGLPDQDGVSVLEKALALRPGLPVVLTSGYAMNERVQLGLDLGAVGFLPKPVKVEALLEALSQAGSSAAPPG